MDHGPVRIQHLISGLGLGGAERMVLWSALHHDRARFTMGVVSLMTGGALAGDLRRTGVELVELGWPKGRLTYDGFRALASAVERFSPHVLQGHMFHSNMLARCLRLKRHGQVVVSTRHIDYERLHRRVLNGATGFLCSGTIVFSGKVREAERKESVFRRPICLAPYGADLSSSEVGGDGVRDELGVPVDAFLWIAVGRLVRQKGYPLMLRAFSDLPPAARLLVVGDGPERRAIEREAARLSVGDRVTFAGARTDVPRLMAASDGFVLSSGYEGGPLVVLEAMAAGLPVVATAVGDVPGMVEDGVTGVVVQGFDHRALAGAMSRIMELGPEAARWGGRGRLRVRERFPYSETQSAMESFYLELLGRSAP